jgi:hypothetical protein
MPDYQTVASRSYNSGPSTSISELLDSSTPWGGSVLGMDKHLGDREAEKIYSSCMQKESPGHSTTIGEKARLHEVLHRSRFNPHWQLMILTFSLSSSL